MSNFFPSTKKKYMRYPASIDLRDMINDFFPQWSDPTWASPSLMTYSQSRTTPSCNVIKNNDHYCIELAAPGYSRDQFNIEIDDSTLSISMKQSSESHDSLNSQKSNYITREFNLNSFTRSWQLPEGTNMDNITASYEAGILAITIPVEAAEVKKRRIKVD